MSLPAPTLRDGGRVLRPWGVDDAPILAEAWADGEIRRFTTVPDDTGTDAARAWIEQASTRTSAIDLVIESDGEVVGEVAASRVDLVQRRAVLSWWLLAEARGHGHATWAVTTLTGWLFGEAGLERLAAVVGAENHASLAVARRCGFVVGARAPDGALVLEHRGAGAGARPSGC